ncbi:MAG: hypothetical protein ACRD19_08785 [Terriglobia bacterium]
MMSPLNTNYLPNPQPLHTPNQAMADAPQTKSQALRLFNETTA